MKDQGGPLDIQRGPAPLRERQAPAGPRTLFTKSWITTHMADSAVHELHELPLLLVQVGAREKRAGSSDSV